MRPVAIPFLPLIWTVLRITLASFLESSFCSFPGLTDLQRPFRVGFFFFVLETNLRPRRGFWISVSAPQISRMEATALCIYYNSSVVKVVLPFHPLAFDFALTGASEDLA